MKLSSAKTDLICQAVGCAKPVHVKKYKLCDNHYRRMKRNGSPDLYINQEWGEARTVRADNYIYITRAGGQVMEHRWKMEQKLGRKLYATEVVHHIDGNRQNNLLTNLQLMTSSEHSRVHGYGRSYEHMKSMRAAKHETIKRED